VTGEAQRGRITPADRLAVRRFLASLPAGQINVALEATTGWRFIVEELHAAGDRASGGAGGDDKPAWAQAAREDRSRERAPPAPAARVGQPYRRTVICYAWSIETSLMSSLGPVTEIASTRPTPGA
jgi:hypothetical protein